MSEEEDRNNSAPTIEPVTTDENKGDAHRTSFIVNTPSRFRLWYALTVFSAISLIGLSTETQEWRIEEKWVLTVAILSLLLSSLASLAHIRLRVNFVGLPLEGVLVCFVNECALLDRPKQDASHSLFISFSEPVVYRVGSLGWGANCHDGHEECAGS